MKNYLDKLVQNPVILKTGQAIVTLAIIGYVAIVFHFLSKLV